MNKDSHILSEAYSVILKEAPIFSSEFDPAIIAPKIKEHKPTAQPNKTPEPSGYQIGKSAAYKNIDIVDLTKDILTRIKSQLLTPVKNVIRGKTYDLYSDLEPDDFKEKVARIIADACGLPRPTTACSHAARILMNDVIDVTALRSGGTVKASSTKIKAKVDAPPSVAFRPEVLDAVAHAVLPDLEPSTEPAPEASIEPSLIKRAKEFKLTGEYQIEDDLSDSAYNKITGVERRDNARIVRERLVANIGKGLTRKGSELVNAAKLGAGYTETKIALKDLLNIGGIIDTAEEKEAEVDLDKVELEPEDPREAKRAAEAAFRDLERQTLGGKTAIRGPNE